MSHDPKHHRRTIRLQGYDYSQKGLYFITLCVQNRLCLFGHIENGIMILNKYGIIAENELLNTMKVRSNMLLETFQVMPNHIHCILEITHKIDKPDIVDADVGANCIRPENENCIRPENENCICQENENCIPQDSQKHESNSPERTIPRSPSQTVGAMVRGYKSAVTSQLITLGFAGKLWQVNYYEHIIRDAEDHERIANYIINNPARWKDDTFFT